MHEISDNHITFENDLNNKEEISDMDNGRGDLDIKATKIEPKQYRANLLTNAQRSFVFLEQQSLIDCVETDGDYIVSAGRDHEINIWDAAEGMHIRRLSGHGGPVTGLHLYYSSEAPIGKIIVSSSEDGSIRQWSLDRGEELSICETENVITCMGVNDDLLAVTGNNKGYIEVRHLSTGDLYSTILAHMDPVDALTVQGKYACSATFDDSSCLKVWDIQTEQTTCIYRIEDTCEIEFCSLAIWNTMVILGASGGQMIHIINFKTKEKTILDLERQEGKVGQVRVWNNWIFSCSSFKKDVVLDVHRIDNYEYYGSFSCNVHQINAIAAMESHSTLKVILGGSSLAVLNFYYVLMQEETKVPIIRITKMYEASLIPKKERGHYTIKNTIDGKYPDEATDSDANKVNSTEESVKLNENISTLELPDFNHEISQVDTELSANKTNNNFSSKSLVQHRQINFSNKPFQRIESTNSHMPFMFKRPENEKMSETPIEPRVLIRNLEALLDANNLSEESKDQGTSRENHSTSKEIIDKIIKKYTQDITEENLPTISEEKNEETSDVQDNQVNIGANANEILQENAPLMNEKNSVLEVTENLKSTPVMDDKKSKHKRKSCWKKNNKESKSNKSKIGENHRRCEIM